MSYMKLIKLLYLADREALLNWGWPITTDSYVSMKHGPVLSGVLNLINEGNVPSEDSAWSKFVSGPEGYDVHLLSDDVPSDELSRAEEGLLNSVFQRFGHMNRWTLVERLHELPEWKDPDGSALPIRYSDILKAGGKSEQDIAAVMSELQSLNASELLVRSL